MERERKVWLGEWAVLAVFAAIVSLVFQQIATAFVEQGAASGDALSNAALFPRMVAGLLLILIVIQAVRHIRKRHTAPAPATGFMPDPPPEDRTTLLGMLVAIIGVLCLYLALLSLIGFHITTTVAIAAMFAVLGVRPFWWALIGSGALTLLVAFVFEILLRVVLPTGIFNISLPLHMFGV